MLSVPAVAQGHGGFSRSPCRVPRKSQLDQVLRSGLVPLPLPPQDGPQFPPKPAVQFLEDRRVTCEVEVINPSPQLRIRFLNGPGHAPSPPVFTDFPQAVLELGERLVTHFQAGFRRMPGHGVPKKYSVPRSAYRAIGLVDREFESLRQELCYRRHDPLTAGLGGNQMLQSSAYTLQVISLTNKRLFPSFNIGAVFDYWQIIPHG